jgi:hypothetical protein
MRGRGACPFGIVLRPDAGARAKQPPFPTWAYTPHYLPAGVAIDVAIDTPLNEPEFFYLGFQRGPNRRVLEAVPHDIPATVITNVSIGTPVPRQQSMAAQSAEAGGVLTFKQSGDYILGLTFDGAGTGKSADLRPHLPLMLQW